jgi:hypothetical protein
MRLRLGRDNGPRYGSTFAAMPHVGAHQQGSASALRRLWQKGLANDEAVAPEGTEETDEAKAPIFIVGCHRSGTTLLRLMLDSHPRISCGPETGLLSDLAALTRRNAGYLSNYGLPDEYWDAKVAEFFDSFKTDYAVSKGKSRWADKTPKYALSLEYILRLFPTCQIVHMVRDGRDVVASHRDRWGYWSAIKASVKWPRYIQAARTAGSTLPPERYTELRYEDLVREPESVLRRLLEFLHEPWDDAVMEHDKKHHDIADHHAAFVAGRRAAAQQPSAIYRHRVGAHKRELDPLLRLLFRLFSRRTLSELGYR